MLKADFAAFDCGGCCFNCFFDIGIGEMTKLFLRLVHGVVADCSLFDLDFTSCLCIDTCCFGFGFVILPCLFTLLSLLICFLSNVTTGLARGEIAPSSIVSVSAT